MNQNSEGSALKKFSIDYLELHVRRIYYASGNKIAYESGKLEHSNEIIKRLPSPSKQLLYFQLRCQGKEVADFFADKYLTQQEKRLVGCVDSVIDLHKDGLGELLHTEMWHYYTEKIEGLNRKEKVSVYRILEIVDPRAAHYFSSDFLFRPWYIEKLQILSGIW